jgi:hypothetical protein
VNHIPAIRKETSYSELKPVTSTPTTFDQTGQALWAAKRETVVDLMMLDGSVVSGLRLTKGVIYPIEFLQVLASSESFNRAELWALFLPTKIQPGKYT